MGQMNDPTSSVKALKEVVVLRIRLQSHQVHLTMLQYYTRMQQYIYNKSSSGDKIANVNFYAVRPGSYPNSLK